MLKKLTKISGLLLIVALAIGMIFMASCSYYNYSIPGYDGTGEVSSQGGFLVEKDGYVYFVNGDASYTNSNKFGEPVRGALMRISKESLAERNYSDVDTVVPLLMYSGSKNAGIFIYGDYVYYTTPATERNSDGEVLNSRLDFKRSRLDGSETMKGRYLQLESNTDEYRYVEVGGVVYILYVVVDEQLYDDMEATATNIHSFNTETEEDTVLAYDVDSYMFDDEDVTNPRIYYTMSVTNYTTHSAFSYNQVYTVTADVTEDEDNPRYPDLESNTGWITEEKATEDDDDDIDEWDVYINLGDMVFDGIGKMDVIDAEEHMTMFNWGYQFKEDAGYNYEDYCNDLRLNYVLSKYTNGTLFYLCDTDNTSNYLFMAKESDILSEEWNPVKDNPERSNRILANGSDAAYNYMFLFDDDGEFTGVIEADSSNINVNYVGTDGKLGTKLQASSSTDPVVDETVEDVGEAGNYTAKYYTIAKNTVATLLFTETDTVQYEDGTTSEVDYLYYSSSGGNGVEIYRVCYTGVWENYHEMSEDPNATDEYWPVQIFNVDAESDWYAPEMVDNQLIFAADSDDMASYNYLMVADLRHVDESGAVTDYMMGNKELQALDDKMDDIADGIEEYSAEDEDSIYANQDTFANLENSIWFAYYTGDPDYIHDLAVMCNEAAKEEDENAKDVYSSETLKRYDDFINCTGDWADYKDDFKIINGEEVFSNRRDYYYTLFGVMDDDEAEDYMDGLKSTWLQDEPEYTWWEGLSTGAKAGFIVGMCLIGLVVIAAAIVIPIVLVRRNRKRKGVGGRQKIAVSLAVDEDVDVYSESLKARDDATSGDEAEERPSSDGDELYDEPQETSGDDEDKGGGE